MSTKSTKNKSADRRIAITTSLLTDSKSNAEFAEELQVSERTITRDRTAIRRDIAETIRSEDVGLVLADIRIAFDKNMRDIGESKKQAHPGTKTYLDHATAEFRMVQDYVSALMDLGVFPKNLGVVHTEKYEFSATVGLHVVDGNRNVTMFDTPQENSGDPTKFEPSKFFGPPSRDRRK